MLRRITHPLTLCLTLLAIVLGLLALGMNTATATDEPCVPKDAWTEVVEHPEVSHTETVVVVDEEAYDEEVFDHWQRYSWTGGSEAYDSTNPPPFPHDDWQANVQGDPHGVGVEGAYFMPHGPHGGGSWFYLEGVTETVHHEAVTHEEEVKVVDKEAWTETIEHPAVTCPPTTPPTTPSTPTETPTVPTEIPTATETPSVTTTVTTPTEIPTTPVPTVPTEIETPSETPTEPTDEETPSKDEPKPNKSVLMTQCLNGEPVLTRDGKVVGGGGTCQEDTEPVPMIEEGL